MTEKMWQKIEEFLEAEAASCESELWRHLMQATLQLGLPAPKL